MAEARETIMKLLGAARLERVLLALAVLSCGCSGTTPPPPSALLSTLGREDGGVFSGKVVVKFKDGTGIRLRPNAADGPFVAMSTAGIGSVNVTVGRADMHIARVSRVLEVPEEEFQKSRDHWARQNVQLHDWNLAFYLHVPTEKDGIALVEALKRDPAVEYAEVLPVTYLAIVQTPDLGSEQAYLGSAASGGLGVKDAWARIDARFPGSNLRGQHTEVVDQEYDWNFDHEVLPIDETAEYLVSPSMASWATYGPSLGGKDVPANIHHGTAVAAIISGQGEDRGLGVLGIVPRTAMRVANIEGGMGIMGGSAVFGNSKVSNPVLTIEVQQRGATSSAGCAVFSGVGGPTATGCVPMESSLSLYNAIKDGVSTGQIIVEGAGNGTVNLNNDADAAPVSGDTFSLFTHPENDSGSIVVGASLGASRAKASWSNCGDRVDVFAWGQGVVTAGYGDRLNPNNVDPNTLPGANDPQLYTGQFGGTSAATAQIAGVAALVQSYIKQRFEEAGLDSRTVVVDGRLVRKILKDSGQPAVYGQPGDPNPNCNIGVQPDASRAIDKADEYVDAGSLFRVIPMNRTAVSGIRYDMDGDGRAELISFSRDRQWFVDLSSNSFGAWDLVFDARGTLPEGGMFFPVVHDYNSDGRADLAVYESLTGQWFIRYTTSTMLNGNSDPWRWDRVIDYGGDPTWQKYSRPLVGDFNADSWLDVSLVTATGEWLVDYGGIEGAKLINGAVVLVDRLGSIEKRFGFLDGSKQSQAPGWAWHSLASGYPTRLLARAPDGIPSSDSFVSSNIQSDGTLKTSTYAKVFGSNDSFFVFGGYQSSDQLINIGFKDNQGTWNYIDSSGWSTTPPTSPEPQGYGDVACRPAPADYDADGKDDRAVQCGTTWRIAYSSASPAALAVVEHPDALVAGEPREAVDPLPGYAYPGGIKYLDTEVIFDRYRDELRCQGGSACSSTSTIFDVLPPVGPYFAECLIYWGAEPSYCWDK